MVCWSRWLIAPQIQGHSEYNSANQVPLVFAYTCQLFPVVELSYNLLCVKNKLRKCDDRRTDGWTDRRFDYAAIGGHVFGKVHYHWESAFVTPHWAGGCCDWMRIRALFGSLFLGKQLALTVCELTGQDGTGRDGVTSLRATSSARRRANRSSRMNATCRSAEAASLNSWVWLIARELMCWCNTQWTFDWEAIKGSTV